jgi:hypothetical protein
MFRPGKQLSDARFIVILEEESPVFQKMDRPLQKSTESPIAVSDQVVVKGFVEP